MLNATFRTIDHWPGKATPNSERKKSRFAAAYNKNLIELEKELKRIDGHSVVIQLYLRPNQIRNDGWPYSASRPSSPGVILTFQQGKESVSMPCDTYKEWEQNLRAITLTLHALRMVSQYGVTRNNEQYKGFKQIAAPDPKNLKKQSAEFIAQHSSYTVEQILGYDALLTKAYREAAFKFHTDHSSSSESDDNFKQLQAHMDILRPKRESILL